MGRWSWRLYLLPAARTEGEADRNHDGVVTAGEIFAYLKQSVRQATDGKQNPRAMVGISSGLTVSTVGRTHARLEIPDTPLRSAAKFVRARSGLRRY